MTSMGDEEILRMAMAPDCPPELLGKWAEDWLSERQEIRFDDPDWMPDERLGAAIAANPNTPPAVLARLLPHQPDAFCLNPAVPLLVLEIPYLFLGFTREQIGSLLRCPCLPATLLALLATHSSDPKVREEASLHVGHAGEVAVGSAWLDDAGRWLFQARANALSGDERAALILLMRNGDAPMWLLSTRRVTKAKERSGEEAAELRHYVAIGTEEWGTIDGLLRYLWLAQLDHVPSLRWGLHYDQDWWYRLGHALNPVYAAEQPGRYATLADDANRYVRAAARARLRGEEPTL